MRTRYLAAIQVVLATALLSTTALAGGDSEPSRGGLPLLLTVGSDATCAHSTLQTALNAAKAAGPENDVIRIAANHGDTAVRADILAHSVTLEGGYANCSASTSSGRTTLDGAGGSVGSVLHIFGGALTDQHVVRLVDLTIRGGEDDGFGGGLDISGGMNVRLERTIVEDNVSAFGGGISIRGTAGASLVVAELSQILSNTASQNGGGIYCESGFAGLFDSAIAFNEANRGGGVAVEGCLFRQEAGGPLLGVFLNTAHSQGGGIYARDGGAVELNGTSAAPAAVISNNAAFTGGGIWAAGSQVRARNAAINSNSADFGGGVGIGVGGRLVAQRLQGGDCHAADRCSTISGNVARRGGALYVNSGSGTADVRQTYIEGNSATEEGSAAYVTVSGRLIMESVVLAGNHGGESVVKLRSDASGLFAFITMTGNNASDAVVVAQDSTFAPAAGLEIYSSILWEPAAGGELLSFDASTPVELDCLVVNSNIGLPPGDFITVQSPIFVDAAGGDYHLHPSSPAVDYCDTAAYSPTRRDIDHQERGMDDPQVPDNFLISWFDIGADALAPPGLIFSDGFESGLLLEWSSVSP